MHCDCWQVLAVWTILGQWITHQASAYNIQLQMTDATYKRWCSAPKNKCAGAQYDFTRDNVWSGDNLPLQCGCHMLQHTGHSASGLFVSRPWGSKLMSSSMAVQSPSASSAIHSCSSTWMLMSACNWWVNFQPWYEIEQSTRYYHSADDRWCAAYAPPPSPVPVCAQNALQIRRPVLFWQEP